MKAIHLLALVLLAFPAASRSEVPLKAELELSMHSGRLPIFLKVTLINISKDTITIIQPVDGSFSSDFLPFYRINFTNSEGATYDACDGIPTCPPRGPQPAPAWPSDYLHTLTPGDSFSHEIAFSPALLPADLESATFSYITDAENPADIFPLPDTVWKGVITSSPFQISPSLKKAEQGAAANP